MKTVSRKEHTFENGRNPFSLEKLENALNKGFGWLVKDNYKDTCIRYYDNFAIVFEEFESHFEVITVYNCNATKFYNNDRFDIIEK